MALTVSARPRRRVIRHSGGRLMGATNALDAYRRFGGKVPATSLAVLVYMALVSKDRDAWPFYRSGQHAIAQHALGRTNPTEPDLRAVQRALKPLLDAGAITVERAGAARSDGNTTARYRLNLHERADKARADWEQTPDGKRRMSDGRRDQQHTTKSGGDIRRKVTGHTTVSDETPDENRRPKETRGDMRSDKTEEEGVDVTTASHPPRASTPSAKAPVIRLDERRPRDSRPPGRAVVTRSEEVAERLREASARVAARRAEHQARLASGENP
jgi:hypothetical protein